MNLEDYMLQISELVAYFENNFEFKNKVMEAVNVMTKFSNDVSTLLHGFSNNFSPLANRNLKLIEHEEVNPFFSSVQTRLPFPLKYVSKPLKKPDFVDFGDGKIFYVADGEDLGFKYLFNMPDHEGFKICKTTGMKNINDLKIIRRFKLMEDFFDIEYLSNTLEDASVDDQDKELILSQILVLHTEYRKRLLNGLGLSVDLAIHTSKTGEWQILKDTPRISISHLKMENLNKEEIDQIASDIRRYFHLEKLYGINLLGETPNFFDDEAISQVFDVLSGRAVIKESVELPDFLPDNREDRHRVFRNLMIKNYPKELTAKIFQKDESQVTEENQFKFKMAWLEEILLHHPDGLAYLENSEAIILRILEGADKDKKFDLEMPLEYFPIANWLQSKASPTDLSLQDLENEIYELSQALLKDVPERDKHEDNFANVVNRHLKNKAILSSKIYQYLSLQEKTSMMETYNTSVILIKEIMKKLELENADKKSWTKPSDHFWNAFAEELLNEIEVYLNNLDKMPLGEKLLENQLLLLQLKRKLKLDVGSTALAELLHRHIKVHS